MFGYEIQDKINVPGEPIVDGNMCVRVHCFEGTLIGDECVCEPGFAIPVIDGVEGDTCTQVPCIEGCDLCDDPDNFSQCLSCTDGYLDIAPSGASYKYCVPECPSGFLNDPCRPDPNASAS